MYNLMNSEDAMNPDIYLIDELEHNLPASHTAPY